VSGNEFETFAKVVVNAAGPFCDSVRKMANSDVMPMICPCSGVHIVLPDYYSPEEMGLIVPKTKDGRVVFMLPWLGRTVAGTTDSNTTITMFPEPHEDEIQFILDAILDYLNVQVLSCILSIYIWSQLVILEENIVIAMSNSFFFFASSSKVYLCFFILLEHVDCKLL
jgi:glycerol-3-phosphate dehydrogenase